MPKLTKFSLSTLIRWLDSYGLLVLSSILLAFIPLYPKIPIYSPIEEYIVRIRLEDFLIALTGFVWIIQALRKKVRWQSTVTWFIGAYAVISFLSVVSAVAVIKTVPMETVHIGKTVLHFLRYLEYFSLFFIVLGSIKTKRDIHVLMGVLVATLIAVAVYGYGQKYYYWPVYSTMNREFSKGVRLYLTEHARVQSTFAGHYDLAAYLVIVLPLVLALLYEQRNKWFKLGLFLVHYAGVWLLIVSAARTSFVAYGVAMGIVTLIYALRRETWLAKIGWGISRMSFHLCVTALLLLRFGSDISERFSQVLNSYPAVKTTYDQLNKQRKEFVEQTYISLGLKDAEISVPTPPKVSPPPNSISTEEAEVIVSSDQRPTPYRPSDVFVDVPDKVTIATKSAEGKTEYITVEKPRTWSENSLRYGLSLAIRLDTLWPQAVRGFLRDPLFGSGYATLNKTALTEFTIAESTDNNFLRTLGETGLLGFIAFYGTVIAGMAVAWKHLKTTDPALRALTTSYGAAAIGLFINAAYIDVFASSKVAFTFWSLTGMVVGYAVLAQKKKHAKKSA